MHPAIRIALGLAGIPVVSVLSTRSSTATLPRLGAQGAQTACSLVDAADLKRLTGREDHLGRGPMVAETSAPGPERTGCAYLQLDFELVSPTKPETFAKDRTFLEKGGATTAPVSGVGDQAYYWWSPKPGGTRPVGIVFRTKSSQLLIMRMTSSDSIEITKPRLLAIAKSIAPKLK